MIVTLVGTRHCEHADDRELEVTVATETLAELIRFAPEVYGLRYGNYVSLFIVTAEGVVVFDPCGQAHPRMPYLLKEAIRCLTDLPVTHVVYSHSTADHSTGGAVFGETASFVGHRNAVAKIAAYGDASTPIPAQTFDQAIALESGGRRIDLYPADLWSDDDYIIVHDPQARVAMFVDLVQPHNVPFRRLLGHPDRIIERLQWLHDTLDFDLIVSGHGTPQVSGSKEDVAAARQYLIDLSSAIEAARRKGCADASPEMTATVEASLRPHYGPWRRFDDFLPLNIDGMIRWRAGEEFTHG